MIWSVFVASLGLAGAPNLSSASAPIQDPTQQQCVASLRSADAALASTIENNRQLLASACYGFALGGRDALSSDAAAITAACQRAFAEVSAASDPRLAASALDRALSGLQLTPTGRLDAVNRCDAYRAGLIDGLKQARRIIE